MHGLFSLLYNSSCSPNTQLKIANFVLAHSVTILLKESALWAQLFVDFIGLVWFYWLYWFHSLYPILLTFHIFMKISQTINTIITYVFFIIKTRQRNFANIISSSFMQFTLKSFHAVSYQFFIKQNINKFFYVLCF